MSLPLDSNPGGKFRTARGGDRRSGAGAGDLGNWTAPVEGVGEGGAHFTEAGVSEHAYDPLILGDFPPTPVTNIHPGS